MKFYLALKSCYQTGIEPFRLYSLMSDLCKGDIQAKNNCLALYRLLKQEDIFKLIEGYEKENFPFLLNSYSDEERVCVATAAKVLRPNWEVSLVKGSIAVVKTPIKVVNSCKVGEKTSLNDLNKQAKLQQINVNFPANKQAITKSLNFKPKEIKIDSLLTDLYVYTRDGQQKPEIYLCKNGKREIEKGHVLNRKNSVFINVDNIVSSGKIVIIIPKGKYDNLKIYKAQGHVVVCDDLDCFNNIFINVDAGTIDCQCSAKDLNITCRTGRVKVKYNAITDGKLYVRNILDGIDLKLNNVSNTRGIFLPIEGKLYKQQNHSMVAGGKELFVNVESKYGDITVG